MTPKFALAPPPVNKLLEKITASSGALLNKPVDYVLLGVSGAYLSLRWGALSLCVRPVSLRVQSLRSIKELEYSRTLRTLYTNAANIVAIHCYQFVWLLPVSL